MAGHETITRMIVILSAAYPRFEVTADTGRVYAELLGDLSDDLLLAAARHHAATSKWFPSVAELREATMDLASRAAGIRTAEEAWKQVMLAVQRHGWYGEMAPGGGWQVPRMLSDLERHAVDALGGWRAVCHSENAAADRAHFLRIYGNLLQRKQQEAMMLPDVRQAIQRLADQMSIPRLEAGR